MANIVLLYIGAVLTMLWGITHLFPTKSVVKDFGEISEDNKNIIKMEWIVEGFSLIFIGMLSTVLTILGEFTNIVTITVYWMSSIMLLALAILSLFTGFKVNFLPFKLCPVIFTASALLIIFGISL